MTKHVIGTVKHIQANKPVRKLAEGACWAVKKAIGIIPVQRPVRHVEIFSAAGKQGNVYQVVKRIIMEILAKADVMNTAARM